MSDLELLFLVLAVLYGWECACWVPRGAVAFRSWLGRRWSAAHPGALIANQRGGFVLAWPLPPLGTFFNANQFPLSISPEAVLAYVAPALNPGGRPPQTGRLVRFEDMRSVRSRGKRVLVNDELLVKAPSPMFARFLVEKLQAIRKAQGLERVAAIEKAARDHLDRKAAENRLKSFRGSLRSLVISTNYLFLCLFLVAPAVVWFLGFRLSWLGLLIALLAGAIVNAVAFRRAHRGLYPEAEDERFNHFIMVLLSPVTAVRARDALSRPLLEEFHPLAVSSALCAETDFRAHAQQMLRETKHPSLPHCPPGDPVAERTERFWRGLLIPRMEALIKARGLDPAGLLSPPKPSEPSCLSYCPRCLAQFVTRSGVCPDCGGLSLVPFDPAGHA